MSNIKTYSVDLSAPTSNDLTDSIIQEVLQADNALTTVKNNTAKVKNETAKILRDIVLEINPKIAPLLLKIHFKPHFWHRDGQMHCSVLITDAHRGCSLRGINIRVSNPSQEVVVNKVTTEKVDFQPTIVVERNMEPYVRSTVYHYTNVSDLLEREKSNLKDMYIINKRHYDENPSCKPTF